MSPAAPDARLSNYRLDRLLGTGGMGSVYLARDLALDRDVAIKFISAEKAADATARHRLVREARAAAALEHPNICAVHEVIVEPDGRAAIVMQYIEGETLADTLRRGPLDVRLAISVATDVANALMAAHRRGIIHRDIKPQNIILTPEKQAKLLDFGVAHQHEVAAQGTDTTTLLTTPGIIVGTPAYMSPEQAQQLAIDGRSDLFSLGAVLFECVTGKRAFTGHSSIDVLGAVLHQETPPVSSLRPELTAQHDEVVRRLLAKHPDDRFKSADELLGALRLLTGMSSRTSVPAPKPLSLWPRLRHNRWARLGVGVLAVVAAVGVWSWRLPEGAPDPAAADWYRRGTDAIRDGAYHEARLALTQAVKAAPSYAPTYVRLAEAETELDDPESAKGALLNVPTESRLPYEHRQRFRAVRAMLLRDVDGAVREYQQLADKRPNDAGVLLDLGRTQAAAGLSRHALATYDKALQIDPQYAAAHLRRGGLLALEGRREEALGEFTTAERLYRAASNVEGEIEALIRRGRILSEKTDIPGARMVLDRAKTLAANLESRAQEIRARLVLATLVTSEGRYDEASVQTRAVIDDALAEKLDTVAAEGLIDLVAPSVLGARGWSPEVDGYLTRAVQLAEKRGALRTAARARLQRAALMAQSGRPGEALDAAKGALSYFRNNRYRMYELSALQVMSRAHEELAQYTEARAFGEQALLIATELEDEYEIAQALENLGGQSNALGKLPEALAYRARGLGIHRRQNDAGRIGYDLVNNADLLIRLGRHAEALTLLDEIDRGAASGIEAYKQRVRRAALMRVVSAAIQQRADEVARLVSVLPPSASGKPDSTSELAAALLRYASPTKASQAFPEAIAGSVSSSSARELRYWDLMGRLSKGRPADALTHVAATLAESGAATSQEFQWRIAAIGAAAARALQDAERERTFKASAQRGLESLRAEWKNDAASYDARPDLTELRRKAGLN